MDMRLAILWISILLLFSRYGSPKEQVADSPGGSGSAKSLSTEGRASGRNLADGDMSWIAETSIAKKLVKLGFAKQEDSFIYIKRMPLGEFKSTLADGPLYPVPSSADGEWVYRTTVGGNYAILEWKEDSSNYRTPTSSSLIHVVVNLELNRRPCVRVGDPIDVVHGSLLHLGARKIKVDTSRPGKLWSQWYVLPEGTCLELRVEDRTAPGGKPFSPTVHEIVLGEQGKGYTTQENWEAQSKTRLGTLSLNGYRRTLE
jgi:hypothetical protein